MILIIISLKVNQSNDAIPVVIDRTHYLLQNILTESDVSLNNEKIKKIFFVETHLNKDRELTNARQACSVETAGKKIINL